MKYNIVCSNGKITDVVDVVEFDSQEEADTHALNLSELLSELNWENEDTVYQAEEIVAFEDKLARDYDRAVAIAQSIANETRDDVVVFMYPNGDYSTSLFDYWADPTLMGELPGYWDGCEQVEIVEPVTD